MSSREMRRLIESMEAAQVTTEKYRPRRYEGDPNGYLKSFIEMYDGDDPMDSGVTTDELIRKAIKMGGGDPKKSSMALYDLTTKNGQGDTDLADLLKAYMVMDKFVAVYPDAKDIAKQAWKNTGGDLRNMADEMYDLTTKNGQGDTDLASAFNAMAGIKD